VLQMEKYAAAADNVIGADPTRVTDLNEEVTKKDGEVTGLVVALLELIQKHSSVAVPTPPPAQAPQGGANQNVPPIVKPNKALQPFTLK